MFVLQCPKLNWFADELSVGAADLYFRCYLIACLFKELYLMQIFSQYLYIKRMIHVYLWIRIYLLELNNLFEGVKDVMSTRW